MNKGDRVMHVNTGLCVHTIKAVFGDIFLLERDKRLHKPLTKNSISSPIITEMVSHRKNLIAI